MKPKELRGEEGQAAVLITILVMFAFIALAALAIDAGHLYVVRRDLQNMSDAACLAAATEFSLGGDETGAYQAAEDYILANGGSQELYTPQDGNGGGLVKGIQVSGGDVRVALQKDVDTYFTMIFNRSSALVGARSRCNPTYGGWLLPIAVRRYDEGETKGEGTDFLANKYADSDWEGHTCMDDCDYPKDSYYDAWDGRYGLMPVYLPITGYVPISGTLDGMETGAIRGDVPPPDGVHEGVLVLGDGVITHSPGGKFKGFILLDARNVANGPVEYYSGASKQRDTNKDISMGWFGTGYTGPIPRVGEQVPVLSGADTKFGTSEMAKYYDVGDAFVAVVYSGYVWERPDFGISITPQVNASEPVTPTGGSPALYTVTLEKVGPAEWATDLNVSLSAEFMLQTITPTVSITPTSMILTEGGDTAQIAVYDTVTDTQYVSAFTVEAYDTVLGLKRWASASFRYGGIDEPDFTLYSDQPEYQAEAGGSLTINLYALGFGGGPPKNNVKIESSVSGDPLVCIPSIIDLRGGRIDIRDGQVESGSYTLKVSDDLIDGPPFLPPEGVTCGIELKVDASPQYPTARTVQLDVRIMPYSPGEAELNTFVVIEGFAPFRVSFIDANTVAAFAIGPIRESPTDILGYQNPRLVRWGG